MDGALFERNWSSPLLRLHLRELETSGSVVNTVLVADGEVDSLTAPALLGGLQQAVRRATANPEGAVIVDVAKVSFMSAAGLRALLTARTATRPLWIVAPSRPVRRVMELAAPGQFPTYPTIDAAVRSMPVSP